MERQEYFTNYLSDHFAYKTELEGEFATLEFNTFDRNILPFLPSNKDAKIVEIGFGTGILLKWFIEVQGYTNVSGVDYSQEVTDFVKENVTKNVTCINDSLKWLKANKGKLDVLIMFDVMEHIPKSEVIATMRAAREALAKGGILLARSPNGSNPYNIQMAYDDFTHEFLVTKNSFEQILSLAGFTDFQVKEYLEENHSLAGKIHDATRPLVFFILKNIIKLSRAFTQPDSLYTRNIYCVARA